MAVQSKANYDSYIRAFYKKKESLEKRGLQMYDSTPMSKSEFQAAYRAERNDMVELVKKGERKRVGNITQNLISQQAYERSLKQSRSLRKAFLDLGYDISVRDIREGRGKAPQAIQALGDIYQDFREDGMSANEAKKLVSQLYFGS